MRLTVFACLFLITACGSNSDPEQSESPSDTAQYTTSFEHSCESESGTNFDCTCVHAFMLTQLDETQYTRLQMPTQLEETEMEPAEIEDILNLAETLDERCAGVLTR